MRRAGVRRSRTFTSRAEAELWAERLEASLKPASLPPLALAGELQTFGAVLERFCRLELPRRRSGAVEAHMLAHLQGHWLLAVPCWQLTSAHFAAYRDERLAAVKPGTVRRAFNLLKPLIDLARDEWGAPINGNPARGIGVKVGDDSRTGRLEPDALQRFLAALRRDPNTEAARTIELALETAMRRSELLSLSWAEIDLAAGTAHLPVTKNGHPRTVALSPRALALLEELPARQGAVLRTSLSSVRRVFARAKAAAGLQEDFCFHQTRHEAISHLWELGLSEVEIANQSGHRDWRSLRRYSHVQASTLAAKLKQLQGDRPANPSGGA